MENIVRLPPRTLARLSVAVNAAMAGGRSLRVCTGTDKNGTWFKFDVGNTGWTEPIYGLDY